MQPTSPTAERADNGLTLFEMLVVISLVALVSFGLPGLLSRDLPPYEATMRDLVQTLRIARSEAIRSGREQVVVLDPTSRGYGLDKPQEVLPLGLVMTVTTGREVALDGLPAIRFYSDGSSSGGRIQISGAERTGVVEIRWLTGSVRREG